MLSLNTVSDVKDETLSDILAGVKAEAIDVTLA